MKVIEIQDMTKEQCLNYLKKKLELIKYDVSRADEIYDLVGGRLVLMNQVISDFKLKRDFERIFSFYCFFIFFLLNKIN
jgi:hypothetical protein